MSSKNNLQIKLENTENHFTITVTASQKITLHELCESIFDECFSQHGSAYIGNEVDESSANFEIIFHASDNSSYHFYQHALLLNSITLLSDIARQFKV